MIAFCYKFISSCGSAKVIKMGQDLPQLLTEVYCHLSMDHI